jgi:transcriptional regulator with XRE-family HTH domain
VKTKQKSKPGQKERPDTLTQEVADELVRLREKKRLGQSDIVKLVKDAGNQISLSHVKKMESGESSPTVRTLDYYLAACGSNLGEFFETWLPREDTKRVDRSMQRLIQQALKDQEGRNHIEGVIKMLKAARII